MFLFIAYFNTNNRYRYRSITSTFHSVFISINMLNVTVVEVKNIQFKVTVLRALFQPAHVIG